MIFIGLLLFFATGLAAQKILVVENSYNLRNIKYYTGDRIMLKFPGSDGRVADEIADMTDSSVILVIRGEVNLEDISGIYRENWLIQIMRGLSLLGGLGYFGIDSFNRLINHENPVIDSGTALISAGMVAFSFALIPLKYRKIPTGAKWKLRTIDLGKF